jgi:hypothetical protein
MAALDQQINSFWKSHVWRCKPFLFIVMFEVDRTMFFKYSRYWIQHFEVMYGTRPPVSGEMYLYQER